MEEDRELSRLPLIGITMGDPAGIGPEIVLKALLDEELYGLCRPVVLGDLAVLASTRSGELHRRTFHLISSPSEAASVAETVDLIEASHLHKGEVLAGKPTVDGGRAMVQYILMAVEMAMAGEIQGMVTCPINKEIMHQAGYPYGGHTQLIAHLSGAADSVMMLAGARLRVALVTVHCALKEVPGLLTAERIYKTISITMKALQEDFGFEIPRLAVAALNPHGGEAGLFGCEDEKTIRPAVIRACGEGMSVAGPLPSDTLFHKAASGEFDAVVAMYHDQGLIPVKLLDFSDAVNVTLGLPIVRTSVDHGTAYDIAGTGKADASSLKAAIKMAAMIIGNRSRKREMLRPRAASPHA